MDKQEYDKRVKELEAKYKIEINALIRECVLSNNTVNVGDILSLNGTFIKVNKIIPYRFSSFDFPVCYYSGDKLKKDLTPFKSGEQDGIHQSELMKIIEPKTSLISR